MGTPYTDAVTPGRRNVPTHELRRRHTLLDRAVRKGGSLKPASTEIAPGSRKSGPEGTLSGLKGDLPRATYLGPDQSDRRRRR